MAERRMFAKSITLSDAFLDLPMGSRCLYFTLGMVADDDGFVNSPKSIMRQCGATEDDLNSLIAENFIISFTSGVVCIKHWNINNYIRADRKVATKYQEEKQMLSEKDNGSYTLNKGVQPNVRQVSVNCPSSDGIGKDSIGKDRLGSNQECVKDNSKIINNIDKNSKKPYGTHKNVWLTDWEYKKLSEDYPEEYLNKIEYMSNYLSQNSKAYKSHYSKLRQWIEEDKQSSKSTTKVANGESSYDLDAHTQSAITKKIVYKGKKND